MSRKQNENSLQRDIVEYLNERSGLGCIVSRIKNTGTYDPVRKCFRKNQTEKGIPDIIGCSKDGKAIFIEVKMGEHAQISKEQLEYLKARAEKGAIVGFAHSLSDAFDIIVSDPINYPRKDRTYGRNKHREALGGEAKKKTDPNNKNPLHFISRLDLCNEQE
tara:strand:+ start:1848 stop:2333 length:486 start_codon:yes stop_codon:yes gene_type:complete